MLSKRVVSKFGGSSVGDALAMQRTARLLLGQALDRSIQPVAVCSACFGTTDHLVRAVEAAQAKDANQVFAIRARLLNWHRQVTDELITMDKSVQNETNDKLDETFEVFFDEPLGSVLETGSLEANTMDIVSSSGERLSNIILSQYVRSIAGPDAARYVAADQVVVTDGIPQNSSPLLLPTRERMQATLVPMLEQGTIPFVTGFFGSSAQGMLTTFGRGGSDLTAALVGYSIDADQVDLYKVEYKKRDDGFLAHWTAGWEGIVHDADISTTIPKVTYQVAAELAHFGKKVLHPSTVHPAVEKEIDLNVRNSLNVRHPGTNIAAQAQVDNPVSIDTITKAELVEYERRNNPIALEPSWDHPKEDTTLVAIVGNNVMDRHQSIIQDLKSHLASIPHALPTRVNGSRHNVTVAVPSSASKQAISILHEQLVNA